MNPNADNLPIFRPGQRLAAADLMKIVDALRQNPQVPGQFVSSGLALQRPIKTAASQGGGAFKCALGRAIDTIPGATGCPDDCQPGIGEIDVEFGNGYSGVVGSCENWSFLSIAIDQFCVLIDIDGHNVIITAFC